MLMGTEPCWAYCLDKRFISLCSMWCCCLNFISCLHLKSQSHVSCIKLMLYVQGTTILKLTCSMYNSHRCQSPGAELSITFFFWWLAKVLLCTDLKAAFTPVLCAVWAVVFINELLVMFGTERQTNVPTIFQHRTDAERTETIHPFILLCLSGIRLQWQQV